VGQTTSWIGGHDLREAFFRFGPVSSLEIGLGYLRQIIVDGLGQGPGTASQRDQ